MDPLTLRQYLADDPPSIVKLAIKPHFDSLNDEEKLYAHSISVACFAGFRIVLRQVSVESEAIYDLILGLYDQCKGDWVALQKQCGLSETDLQHFLNYAAQFLGNGGNFKSFGDSKFIPRLPMRQMKALATSSSRTLHIFEKIKDNLYENSKNHLGYPDAG